MHPPAELRCRCGTVHGTVTNVGPDTVHRAVCYCDDCQAALHHLKRTDLLDAHGGSDLEQVAPAALRFDRGADRIACLRLTPKGLYRSYASCCSTPLGNTFTPAIPLVGILVQAFDTGARGPDDVFGKQRGAFVHDDRTGRSCAGEWQSVEVRLHDATVEQSERRDGWVLNGSVRVDAECFDNMLQLPFRRAGAVVLVLSGVGLSVAVHARSVWLVVVGPPGDREAGE